LTPKPTAIFKQEDMHRSCGFANKTTTDDKSIGTTCIALVKGKRFGKEHVNLQQKLIRQYPKLRFVSVDAAKRRLSFEDSMKYPANSFALKVYAMRNGTHHLSMQKPVTWDYISNFVDYVAGTPLYDFDGDANTKLSVGSGGGSVKFKDRTQRMFEQQQKQQQEQAAREQAEAEKDMTPGQRRRAKQKVDRTKAEAEKELTPEELEAQQREKERRSREAMDRMAQESMFEEVDPEETAAAENQEGEEDEDIIEL